MYIQPKYIIPVPKRKKCWACRTKKGKANDVEIIISGDEGAAIAAELKLTLQKMGRKRELNYCITLRHSEIVSSTNSLPVRRTSE